MEFEWHVVKNRINLEKHGIDFDDARAIFNGFVLEYVSAQNRHGEVRVLAIGILNGREIAVIYTERATRRRMISARRTRTHEREEYERAHKRYFEG